MASYLLQKPSKVVSQKGPIDAFTNSTCELVNSKVGKRLSRARTGIMSMVIVGSCLNRENDVFVYIVADGHCPS